MDMERNAMVKSVLHRPTGSDCGTKSELQDPLEPYMLYHARPPMQIIYIPGL